MATCHSPEVADAAKKKIFYNAVNLFLEKGFTATTYADIAKASGYPKTNVTYMFKTKEAIIAELVKYVIDAQFKATNQFVGGKTNDKILFYAAETTLQLYIAESNENIREIYSLSYSLPTSSAIIQKTLTGILEDVFKENLPDLETKDFYKREIASGGVMRGFLTIPCDMWFTMDQKIEAFLENTFKLYDVPPEKIKEAIDFVSQFDYPAIAKKVVDDTMKELKKQAEEAEAFLKGANQ